MLGHMVVSFVLPPVGLPEHVFVQVDRLVGAIRTRHLDDNHRFAIAINDLHVLVRQDIRADLVAVVERVREVLNKLLGIAHTDNLKMLVLKLLHTQEDHATIGVVKSRIGLPKAAGQPALRLLTLQMECLALLNQGVDVLLRPLHLRHRLTKPSTRAHLRADDGLVRLVHSNWQSPKPRRSRAYPCVSPSGRSSSRRHQCSRS